MKSHKFDVEDAKEHGVNKAIILQHLKFHQGNNEGIKEYEIDGKIWCHARRKTLQKMYPYFNARSISRWLKELEEDGVIESCKPQVNGGDHTKYYRVPGYENGNGQNVQRGEQEKPQKAKILSLEDSDGNGQNDQSNGQSDHSTRDNKVQGNGQNVHSSNSDCSVTNYVEGARVNGVPLPEELVGIDGLVEKYEQYCRYLKENYNRWPTASTTEIDFQKLASLKEKGNPPKAVIDQTMHARNKSFYPIRNFDSEQGQDSQQSMDYTGVANAGMYQDPDEN